MKLRILTGGIIALHGVLSIIFIESYTDFVFDSLYQIFPFETILMVSSAIFPFLEFFIGLLIIFNLGKNGAICGGFLISLVMSSFIVTSGLNTQLIYHAVIVSLLAFLCIKQLKTNRRKITL